MFWIHCGDLGEKYQANESATRQAKTRFSQKRKSGFWFLVQKPDGFWFFLYP
jgi:hypothetical protein